MNVVFTCGGTAGHINPAIAVANIWKERHPEGKVLFIGGDDMEMELVPKAGYELVGFPSASFCRGLHMHAFRHNARAVGLITRAISKCKRVLRDFQADVVIGTGGYASYPMVKAAAKAGTSKKPPRNRESPAAFAVGRRTGRREDAPGEREGGFALILVLDKKLSKLLIAPQARQELMRRLLRQTAAKGRR